MEETRNVQGLAELSKRLNDLPAKMEAKILRGALRASAKVMLDAAKARVPYTRSAMAERYGHIRDTMRITTRMRKGVLTASVKTGKDQFWAIMVERGTEAHTITARTSRGLRVGGGGVSVVYRTSVAHPGAKPRPFMRPAFDASADAALTVFAQHIEKKLPEALK